MLLLRVQPPSVDVFNGVFVIGDANDLLLDNLAASIKPSGRTVADLCVAAAEGANLLAVIYPPLPSADPSAPAPRTEFVSLGTSSNSVSLSWAASLGGSGGVYSYTLYRDGQQIASTKADVTHFVDTDRPSGTSSSYSVTATSAAGTSSQRSALITASTLPFGLLAAKLKRYIVFEIATGKIWSQMFASPGAIALAAPLAGGYDIIEHPRTETTVYGIRSEGNRQYSVYL